MVYSPLPYFGNRLVSIGYKWLQIEWHTTATIIRRSRQPGAFTNFNCLNHADVLIGQHIKFDLTGYESVDLYKGDIYDTMVAEYILAKARRWPLGLAALAEKYDVTRKEKDLVEPYLKAVRRSTNTVGDN